MRNNNQAIVRKITGRALRSDKRRNFFIVAAIALTAFMIASVFSVGMSYYETIMIAPFRTEGIRSHAALADTKLENMETLRSLDYVNHISILHRVGVGYLNGFDRGISIGALNEESWRFFQTPVYTDIVGNFAIAENEIMLARAHLERMGINEPYIGMEIPMDFEIGDFITGEFSEKQSGVFILSAIYTEFISIAPGDVFTPLFVSEAFAEQNGMLRYENTSVNVLFNNQGRATEYAKRMAQDLNLDFGTEVFVHPALEKQADTGSSTMYFAISIIVAFFMFVGFLLIYNVMYISVSKDVRFYGLLKTMGTTPKQLGRIVNGQVLMLCLIGLPIGLGLAALASFAVVPSFLTGSSTQVVISFSPLIYTGGAIFALLTAYLGASISARKAAKVSPIEAIRYTGEQNFNLKLRSGANGKPYRMAWRNMFRERKRAYIVLLSLFLGLTVFTGVISIVNSMDIAGSIDYWYDNDIAISSLNVAVDGDLGLIGMDRGFIEEITNLPGVIEIIERTEVIALYDYPSEIVATAETGGFYNPILTIIGIDRTELEKKEILFDVEAFERGEIALVDERSSIYSMGNLFYDHYSVGAELSFEIGQQSCIPVNCIIAGYTQLRNMTGNRTSIGADLTLIMSNTFLESISCKGGVNHLGVNIEKDMAESVNAAISAKVKERGMMAMASAFDAQREQEATRLTMFVLGASISGILALIGIFNFINLITVGLLTRKREFAALESVGMSKKQMRLMLRWEGAIYWILTILVSITAGTGITYGLFWLVHNQDPILLPHFIYPVLPVTMVFCLIIFICTITPEICYRGIAKSTLVERLREAE